jgi:hypothetical protein
MLNFSRLALLCSVIAVLLFMRGSAWSQGLDQVYLTKGPPSRGTISEAGMSRDKVTLDGGGAAREIAVNEIVRITYKDEPAELNSGRNHTLQRNLPRDSRT